MRSTSQPFNMPPSEMLPTSMQRPLNFAVIGCGTLARGQHIPNLAKSSKARLHSCCDLSSEVLNECRQRYGALKVTQKWEEVVSDSEVEAVVLATTEKLRLKVIAACISHRKPVYVEKPLATTLAEAREIQQLVNDQGVPFCVGHNRRASPAMIDAHRIFRGHMLDPRPTPWRFDREGTAIRPKLPDDGVASMSVRINDDWYSWKSWVFDHQQAPHGPMLFEMTHFTDLCNWFLASRPVEVMASAGGMLNHGVIIRYEMGEIATILMGSNGSFDYPKELYEVMGKGGVVVVDHMLEIRTAGILDAPLKRSYPMLKDRYPEIGTEGGFSGWVAKKQQACQDVTSAGDPSLAFSAEPDKGHAHALEMFVDEIRGVGPKVCDVDSALLATQVAFAAIKSVQERRAVKMEEV